MKFLVGLLVVVAGVAYYVTNTDSGSEGDARYLMPNWHDSTADLAAISQVQLAKDGELISVVKEQGYWIIEGGFLANTEPLSELIQSFQTAEIVEVKTANPKNHQQLELSGSDLKVSFYEGDKILGEVHVGKRSNSGTVFVRKATENQTYSVSGIKDISFNQDSWQLKTVLDYPADSVESVEFAHTSGESFSINRDEDGLNFSMSEEIPEGYQLKPDVQLNDLATGLARLMIDEAVMLDLSELQLHATNSYLLKNGSVVVLKSYQNDEDYFITVDSDSHAHLAPWLLKVAAYKFNALTKNMDDLIEPISVTSTETKDDHAE